MSRHSMMRRGPGLAVGAAACVVVGVACYGPTEVRLEISTDLPCRAATDAGVSSSAPVHTFVRLGGAVDAPIVADTTACGDRLTADGFNDIGSIVLVPSGDRSAHVTVQVSATADGSNPDVCGRPDTPPLVQAQCIVARRTFAFIKHTSRSLPVRLYASCKGQVCGTTETCNKSGHCESAAVSDDTGCIASEPNCNDTVPGAVPDAATDAGGDAPAVDAADATATRPPCTAADGTNVLVTNGGATELMAVNSKKIFYVVPGPTFNGAGVAVIDTQDPKSPTTLFNVSTGPGGATAIAADELAVWVASSVNIIRYNLADGMQTTFPVTDTLSIALSTALDVETTTVTKAYAATAAGGPKAPTGGVYELLPDGTPMDVFSSPGTSIVATNRSLPTLFMFAPQEYNGPLLYRGQPHLTFPPPINVAAPFTGMATDDAFAFFAAGTAIQRVDATAALPTVLYAIATPGRVAVDQASVFFEQKGKDSAIFRGSKVPPGAGALIPAVRVATGFTDVRGLVIDAACVYFWSSTAAGGDTLNVFPKTRTVVGAPPTTTIHTP